MSRKQSDPIHKEEISRAINLISDCVEMNKIDERIAATVFFTLFTQQMEKYNVPFEDVIGALRKQWTAQGCK